MKQVPRINCSVYNFFDFLKVFAGIVLLFAISWQIIAGDHLHFSGLYMIVQLIVCIIFLCDFFIRLSASERPWRFLRRNILFLLISIPYLNILMWCNSVMTRDWAILISLIPMIRAFLAFIIVVKWMVDSKVGKLFWAYIFTVVVFTYLAGLVFYEYEALVNPKLKGFGNAIWWAWMNVTTVGAAIFPVTAVGKVICVMLPSLGMMMFPIFTSYVLQEYSQRKKKKEE